MTENRFELIWETDEMCNVFDNDIVSTLSVEEVCDLLNEFDRRCNRWVSENKRLKKEIILIEKRADKVYNENEQLKEIITGQRDTIKRDNEWENKAIEEIKQLKQYKQAVNDVLDSYYQRDLTPIEEILVGGIARELNIDLHYKYKGDVE